MTPEPVARFGDSPGCAAWFASNSGCKTPADQTELSTVYFRTEQTSALMRAADFQTKLYEGASFRKLVLLSKKLDWIWGRNLDILESDVQGQIEASDHRPVWAQLRWRSDPNQVSQP